MFCMEFNKGAPALLKTLALTSLVLVLPPGTTKAQDGEIQEASPEVTLSGLGLDLEAARRAADQGDPGPAEALARALADLDGDSVPKADKAAAALLWGQVNQVLGRYDQAGDQAAKARKKSKDPAVGAAAGFAEIEALEAEGRSVIRLQ